MHPNRATSTLFSQFAVVPRELTAEIKGQGLRKLTAIVRPKEEQRAKAHERRTIDIPLTEMPDNIALPPQAFFEMGYAPGDPLQFRFQGSRLNVTPYDRNQLNDIESCEIDDDGVRIPPAWLIQAFTGAADTVDHIENGKRSADYYVDLYNQLCGNFGDVESVLDFGCGCGRVLSRMPAAGDTRYFGVDLRDDALDWLRKTMPDGTFVTGTELPPVDLDAGSLDLIYSVSVLTHLTQEQEGAWLDEWQRLLKPGGHVIATFRGEDWVEQFAYANQKPEIRKDWAENGGFCYQKHRYWEGIFPEYYSGTYHTADYVRETWGKRFEILDIRPAAETPNEQNTAVMRKKP